MGELRHQSISIHRDSLQHQVLCACTHETRLPPHANHSSDLGDDLAATSLAAF